MASAVLRGEEKGEDGGGRVMGRLKPAPCAGNCSHPGGESPQGPQMVRTWVFLVGTISGSPRKPAQPVGS